jgi:membrane protease subunit HflK
MSQYDPNQFGTPGGPRGDDGLIERGMGSFEPGPLEAMPVEESRRAASAQLRGEDIRAARATSLEAANKSLAEALDIIYRLILIVMVGLVAMFLFSGFQQIRESEVGVRVAFGAITNDGVEPGFAMSLPKPFGELVRINTAPETVELSGAGEKNTDFWPQVANPLEPLENQGVLTPLRPGRDGSLITADGNIIHAQLTVNYRRSQYREYLANFYDHSDETRRAAEVEFVRRAVMRGTVKTVSQLTVDEILRRGGSGMSAASTEAAPAVGFDPIVTSIQREAQDTLNALETGLTITSIQLRSVSVPARVIPDFKAVSNAVTEASQRIEQARTEASQILSKAAGAASQPAIALIRQYEQQLDAQQLAKAEQTLGTLRQLFDGSLERAGQPLRVGDATFTNLSVGGSVATTIASARQEADTRTSRARSVARSFQAKLTAYRANPRLFMSTEWSRAMLAFLNRSGVEVFMLPDDLTNVRLSVNTDPEFARRAERAEHERQMRENPRYREAMRAGELVQ